MPESIATMTPERAAQLAEERNVQMLGDRGELAKSSAQGEAERAAQAEKAKRDAEYRLEVESKAKDPNMGLGGPDYALSLSEAQLKANESIKAASVSASAQAYEASRPKTDVREATYGDQDVVLPPGAPLPEVKDDTDHDPNDGSNEEPFKLPTEDEITEQITAKRDQVREIVAKLSKMEAVDSSEVATSLVDYLHVLALRSELSSEDKTTLTKLFAVMAINRTSLIDTNLPTYLDSVVNQYSDFVSERQRDQLKPRLDTLMETTQRALQNMHEKMMERHASNTNE